MAPTPLEDVKAELERLFRQGALEKKLEFTIDQSRRACRPPSARNATRLKQILKNLLANAFKFTPRGAVRLRIAPRGGRCRRVFR